MQIQDKIRKVEFLNLLGGYRGRFVIGITPDGSQAPQYFYSDGGTTFDVPDAGIDALYDIAMEGAKLTREKRELDARKTSVTGQYLDGAMILEYDRDVVIDRGGLADGEEYTGGEKPC